MDLLTLFNYFIKKIITIKELIVAFSNKSKLRFFPKRITLNLSVTHRCNSNCKMCNIWKENSSEELSKEDLKRITQDPLFSNIKYVGISGGEPSLHSDLIGIVEVLVDNLKNLKSIGIITNGIDYYNCINKISLINTFCKKRGVLFNVLVSLDGTQETHEEIRGIKGCFKNAIHLIKDLKDMNIPISVGCTIIKDNVWNVNELLYFCIRNDIYIKFRIAEYINRLNNDDLDLRNFNRKEIYQLALFFYKLEHIYEKNRSVKNTYYNIRNMLLYDKERCVSCPYYEKTAVIMESNGDLFYCSPKSPLIGNCLSDSASALYHDNLNLLKDIKNKYCKNCIHDYHSNILAKEFFHITKKNFFKKYYIRKYSIDATLNKAVTREKRSINQQNIQKDSVTTFLSNHKTFIIIGWYGTETVGDKAILEAIIEKIYQTSRNPVIYIASLYPFITEYTLHELEYDNVEIVNTFSYSFKKKCSSCDVTIIGGGPLMNMEYLGYLLSGSYFAKKNKKSILIYGCGIGPLNKIRYIDTVKKIVDLSDFICVRDINSKIWIENNCLRNDILMMGDPAKEYVNNWLLSNNNIPEKNIVSCYLREWTTEYLGNIPKKDYEKTKKRFEENLANLIRYVYNKSNSKIRFLPMHTFTVGNDDRDFYYSFYSKYLSDIPIDIGSKVYSPSDILKSMKESKFCICMRFHSVLFADTLHKDFIGIDYTQGGKVKNFLKDNNKLSYLISFDDLSNGTWKDKIDLLWNKI